MNVRFAVWVGLALLCAVGSMGAAEAVAACPNEALRAEARSTQLPECRAYELVSPVDTADSGVLFFDGAAPDGEAAEFFSAGGFAGIGSEYAFNHYVARRSSQGWVTSWVGVPAALRGLVSGMTSSFDLTKQVVRVQFLAGAQAGTTGLFFSKNLAEAPALSFEELPEYENIPHPKRAAYGIEQPVDESPDFSHLIIPDTEVVAGNQLYELAGVGGPAPVVRTVSIEPPPNEGVIGAELGNGEGRQDSVFHAISNDGEEIFFTSGISYVRVNGAKTLALDGLFEGASGSGTKVFLESAGGELFMDLIDSESGREAVTERVAIAPAGDSNTYLRSSDDGSHLYFLSTGVLAANENENGEKAEEGEENLYVYDTVTKKAAFIARAVPGGNSGEIEAQCNGCPGRELGEPKNRVVKGVASSCSRRPHI